MRDISDKKTCCFFGVLLKLTMSFIVAVGLAASGYFISGSIDRFRSSDRTVIVKGLSEREVKSDLAVWKLNYKRAGDELNSLQAQMSEDKEAIIDFLRQLAFSPKDVQIGPEIIKDKMADEYVNKNSLLKRYFMYHSITIRTNNVDLVEEAAGKLGALVQKGILVTGEPRYHFTGFDEIRPEMISEAVQSAQKAAQRFFKDTNHKMGVIERANQGAFSIMPKDSSGEDAYAYHAGSKLKKIRVVNTVTFRFPS